MKIASGDCLICAMEDAADDVVVVARDDLWACEIVPGYEVPGWFVLRTRRHAIGLPGLTPEELATFGPRARDAITLIAARGDDVPPGRRSGDILKLRTERADPAAAARLVPAVRAAYQKLEHR
jgi:hypothetical protein